MKGCSTPLLHMPFGVGVGALNRNDEIHWYTMTAVRHAGSALLYDAPRASLSLGQGLHLERIHEGQDVYLECAIRANPWISDVLWTLDGEPLEDGTAAPNGSSLAALAAAAPPSSPSSQAPQTHVLLQEQYLVLRNVTSKFTGSYACHVRSARGEAVSNSLDLRVQYTPRCKKGLQEVFRYSTSREELFIPCEMDADPEDLTFHWVMKNNSEVRDLATFTTNGSRSVARYKPAVATEFVSLMCWANNSVGAQRQPCTFFVEPHGAPKALSGCSVVNQAMTWFFVRCAEDDAEDRPTGQEWYLLEVFHADTGALLGNVSSRGRPVFQVDAIPPATECLALAYAVNERGGRSEPARVVVQAIPPPSKLLTGGVFLRSFNDAPYSVFIMSSETSCCETLLTHPPVTAWCCAIPGGVHVAPADAHHPPAPKAGFASLQDAWTVQVPFPGSERDALSGLLVEPQDLWPLVRQASLRSKTSVLSAVDERPFGTAPSKEGISRANQNELAEWNTPSRNLKSAG
ncbi:hypothetical protein HPB48_013996 [Haemaphysalis longicornis]|uniref:Ig-like domain-containing protein n=1 Tax=Haemaphysalis longicornis TaxID=44386 RepID=A0A9J6G7L1_HAELO|nr:hypothetical protein HPB48_013996 [Haemaphysalis longicornis]